MKTNIFILVIFLFCLNAKAQDQAITDDQMLAMLNGTEPMLIINESNKGKETIQFKTDSENNLSHKSQETEKKQNNSYTQNIQKKEIVTPKTFSKTSTEIIGNKTITTTVRISQECTKALENRIVVIQDQNYICSNNKWQTL